MLKLNKTKAILFIDLQPSPLMELWHQLSPELRDFLFATATNAAGGLIGNFVDSLLRSGGRRLQERFAKPEAEQALERAASAAITAVIADWQRAHPDYADLWARFGAWLLHPAVLTEFRILLTPSAGATFNMEMLRDEFEAAGLDVAQLSDDDFDGLVQAIVGEFYAVAATETVLAGPLQIGLLRQMAEAMGALERLAARQNHLSRHSLGQLARLNLVAERVADGHDETNLLLREMLVVLREHRPQTVPDLQRFYEQIRQLLSRADLGDFYDIELGERAYGVAIGEHARVEITNDFAQVQQLLTEIRNSLIAAQPELTSEELVAMERHYRQSVIDRFEKLTFRGITPSGTALSLNLADVYVELKAVADIPEAADTYSADERRLLLEADGRGELVHQETVARLDALRLERWRADARRQREAGSRFQRRSIGEMIADPRQRGLVILGDPGSGKSTLLHYLALTYAGERQQIKNLVLLERPLPIFVPLAAYDDHLRRTKEDLPLGDFLALYYEKWRNLPGLAPLFQVALEQGRGILLFDGLDEVLETTTRQFVAEQAGALIQRWQGRGNRFIVTSRVVGYREARLPGDLPHVTVLDFGRPEIQSFAHQWCYAYEVWAAGRETPTALQQATTEEAALLDDVHSNPNVEQLAANPLLLTMLALLRRQVGKLPDRRIELYERYTRTLIDNREQERSRGARQQAPSRFDPHRAIAHLMDLALWLQMHRPSGTARRIDLEHALVEICLRYDGHDSGQAPEKLRIGAQKDAEAFLNDMRHFAGLLGERGRDAFGFLHLTFQEYFAGRALARLDPDKRWAILQPRLHLHRWREPILLCAGQLGVIEQRHDVVSNLVKSVANAASEHEALLHRDLFLAAAIMADDVGITQSLYTVLYERLTALYASLISTIQDRAVSGLAHLARLGYNLAEKLLLESLADANLQLVVMRNTQSFFTEENGLVLRKAITTLLDDDGWEVRQVAVEALAGLVSSDAQVRQAIIAKLDDEDNEVQEVVVQALAGLVSNDTHLRQTITARLDDSRWGVRQAAVQALAGLVSSDAHLRQAIIAKLDDEDYDVQRAAVQALAGLVSSDAHLRQAIIAKLDDDKNDSWGSGRGAIQALAGLVSSDVQVRQTITARLDDNRWGVRQAAVQALAGLVSSDAHLRQATIAKLDDEDDDVRKAAVQALAGLVSSDAQVYQGIIVKLDDDKWGVRQAAVQALAGLVSSDAHLRQAIIARLDDEDNDVRQAAVQALAGLVSSDAHLRQAITTKLDDDDYDMREIVVRALASLVSSDAQVRRAIIARLDDDGWEVRQAAVQALASLVNSDAQVRQATIAKLDDRDDSLGFVRQAVVQVLAGLVSSDAQVRQAIAAKLDAAAWPVRQGAVQVLAGLVSSDAQVRQAIIAKLDDNRWGVRQAAVQALASVVSSDAQVRQAIIAKLDDEDDDVRKAAVQVLAGLVNSDAQVYQGIIVKLDDDKWGVRKAAVQALTSLASSDAKVRQAIIVKLGDEDYDVQQAAVQLLAGLVSSDAQVRQVIADKLDDEDEDYDVQQAAVQVLAGLVSSDTQVRQVIIAKLNDDDRNDSSDSVRQAAVQVLAGLVSSDTQVRQAITAKLNDDTLRVREAAVEALAGSVSSDIQVRQAITAKLNDDTWKVREAAVEALAGLVSSDTQVRQAITAKLDDPWGSVRQAAVQALIGLIPSDPEIYTRLMPWLGARREFHPLELESAKYDRELRNSLAEAYAPLVATDSKSLQSIVEMLDAPTWPQRCGAALVLLKLPSGPPPTLHPRLVTLLNDTHGEESWPKRLDMAGLLINDRDAALSQHAIATVVEALDYATQPWYHLPLSGSAVRKQAITILGQLEPLYRDDKVFAKLTQVMQTDQHPDVRDTAYGALLRLAAAPEANTDQ